MSWLLNTLVVVFKIEDDLIEVLKRQSFENLFLSLRIVGDMT
jgi:hypothetical protein